MKLLNRVCRALILLLSIGLTSITVVEAGNPSSTTEDAKKQAVDELNFMLFRVKMFLHDASSSIISSVELPQFEEYFSLPESQENKYDELGRLQLSEEQNRVRQSLEEWILKLHNRFPIGETCLIDRHGQEHLRVVGGKVEKPVYFSAEEHGSPFFMPTLEIEYGKVYISDPYMSPDSFRWVVAFTSPVVKKNGASTAFYHFEVPLSVFQSIIYSSNYGFTSEAEFKPDDDEGRYFILDRKSGLLIADSRQNISYELVDERHPDKNQNLPDFLPPELLEDYLPSLSTISDNPAFLKAAALILEGGEAVEQLQIDGEEYILAYYPIPNRDWSIAHLDPVNGIAFWER